MRQPVASNLVIHKSQQPIGLAVGSIWEQIYATHVLSYLSTYDLCSTSRTCVFFRHTCQITHLWTDLIESNFAFPSKSYDENVNVINNSDLVVISQIQLDETALDNDESASSPTADQIHQPLSTAKEKYALRLLEKNDRFKLAKERALVVGRDRVRGRQQRYVKAFLDITFFRILIPLPFTALFLSIILLALHFDGLKISIWWSAAPVMFYFVYLLILSILASFVYNQRQNQMSILYGLWVDVQGPLKTLYFETLECRNNLLVGVIIVVVMCLLQIIFVAVKLSPATPTSGPIKKLDWGVVFLPIWILFTISPFLGCLRKPVTIFLGFFCLWFPLLIVIICLTVKLNGEDKHNKYAGLRMAFVFLPFWIIEGFFMISSLIFLLLGIYRRCSGLSNALQDNSSGGFVFSIWLLLGPFVIFQSLICDIDDSKSSKVSHTESVAPILVLLGWFLTYALYVSLRSRTPFQDIEAYNARQNAGSSPIFNV